ncbi:hypothetical protein I4U23_031020 [Adineta vaga]|nr:hypothetical protein I4U23_031020 [Adineta vaga]
MECLRCHKQLNFFNKEHPDQQEIHRPVLTYSSLSCTIEHKDQCDDCHRTDISLIEMKLDEVADDCQLSLWIVTQPQPTNMVDVINNWSYITTTNETKSMKSLSHILDELLPIGSMIKLYDPLLIRCSIDNQPTLRCNAPNIDLILSYIRGDLQFAIDYYTFGIARILTIARMTMSKACYLRERLYFDASMDSTVVVTGHLLNKTSDELFFKCLYRLICANIALVEFSFPIFELLNLSQTSSIDPQIRCKYLSDYQQLNANLDRLKDQCAHGIYSLKTMFHQEHFDQKTQFDFQTYHYNFYNTTFMKNRHGKYYSKCIIPPGTLLLAQNAFAYVKSGDNEQRRLLNEIEKHLIMAPTAKEFYSIRMIPLINHWFENIADVDEDDHEIYPKEIPWGLLLKIQQKNRFRSKTLLGWWPNASVFKLALNSKQKSNCPWFICGIIIFLFNYIPINKSDEIIIADHEKIYTQPHPSTTIHEYTAHKPIAIVLTKS